MKKELARKTAGQSGLRKTAPAQGVRPSVRRESSADQPFDEGPVEDIRDAVSRLKRERIISTAVDLFYHHGLG